MRRYIAQAGGAPAGETIGASGIRVTRMRHGGAADGRSVKIRVGIQGRKIKPAAAPPHSGHAHIAEADGYFENSLLKSGGVYAILIKYPRVCNTVILTGESAVPCSLQSATAGVICLLRAATVRPRRLCAR